MWKRPENEHSQPEKNSPTSQQTPVSASPRTVGKTKGGGAVIGPSITVRGDMSGEEDLQVEGRVEGKIDLKRNLVRVGPQGRVKADIYGRLIEVEGEVEGNLFGEEQIIVRKSGAVRGNITAPRVSLEDGANFKGTIDMDPKANERKVEAAKRAEQAKGDSKPNASSASPPPPPNQGGNRDAHRAAASGQKN